MIELKVVQLNASEIYNYLEINDKNFIPPLSGHINLRNFSLKLYEFATKFCVLDDKIIGFAACYLMIIIKEQDISVLFLFVKSITDRVWQQRCWI